MEIIENRTQKNKSLNYRKLFENLPPPPICKNNEKSPPLS